MLRCSAACRESLVEISVLFLRTQTGKSSNGEITQATSRREKDMAREIRYGGLRQNIRGVGLPNWVGPPQRAQTWHSCAYQNQKKNWQARQATLDTEAERAICLNLRDMPLADIRSLRVMCTRFKISRAAALRKFHEPGFCAYSGALVEAILRSIAGASVFRREEKTKTTADNGTDLTSAPEDKRGPG